VRKSGSALLKRMELVVSLLRIVFEKDEKSEEKEEI
jgi:hypothetical protein